MSHNDIRHMLSEYLDGSITAKEKAAIDEHLKICPECENALNELRKTIEHVKSVEEIDPPAWMAQKIMARVRTEAEEKKSLFEKLFFPLSIKLPIQAVAIVFLTVTAFYIYRDVQPTEKLPEVPISKQELAPKKESAPPVAAKPEQKKADDSLLRSKQVPQAPGYKSLDMKQEYEAPAPPVLKGKMAESAPPAPSQPAEQPSPEKKDMMLEKRAAATQAAPLGKAQEQALAGAPPRAKVKSAPISSLRNEAGLADKAEPSSRFEKDIVEKHSNGQSKLVITYEIIDGEKFKRAEEQFNSDGERQGIQKEYYTSGQLKTEAEYESGRLNWYKEYEPDGSKKIGKSDYDWFWLKK